MVAIPLPTSSFPGAKPQESSGRLINAYAEPKGTGGTVVRRRAPGFRSFATSSETGPRGIALMGNDLFVAHEDILQYATSVGGIMSTAGVLAGALPVYFARNKAAVPDQVVVTENGAFIFTTASILAYPDPDLPQPLDGTWLAGYFFFAIGDNRCFASGINSTSINPIDFTTALNGPGNLIRCIPFNGSLFLFKTGSIERYNNTGNATGFPFSYAYTINRGLLTPTAVTGFEDNFGRGLFFAADDNTVCMVSGQNADKISPPDLDRLIEALDDKTELEMYSYVSNGHAFVAISSDTWTWTFDLNNSSWHERYSGTALQMRWRPSRMAYAFGKWISGDTESGNLVEITAEVFQDDGDPIKFRIESDLVKKFPSRVSVARADFDIVAGTAGPGITDPCEISWSDDGGPTWSNPLQRHIVEQGQYKSRVFVTRTGLSQPVGRRWRVDYSGNSYFGITAAEQSVGQRIF